MAGKHSTKLFYKIGEVCRLTGIKPHILRYWESEFTTLNPRKSRGGQRVYQEKDLETVRRIKRMLHEEGYTIAGARKKLSGGPPQTGGASTMKRPKRHGQETDAGGCRGQNQEGRRDFEGGARGCAAAGPDDPKAANQEVQIADTLGRFKKEIIELLEIIS